MNHRTMPRVWQIVVVAFIVLAGCSEPPTSQPQPPAVPLHLKATEATVPAAVGVDLTWDGGADSAGVTGYRVWWGRDSSLTDSASVAGTARTYRLENLLPDSLYTFAVAAVNNNGISPKASITWKAARPGVLAPPSDANVIFTNDSTARVMWAASPDSRVLNYRVVCFLMPGGDSVRSVTVAGTAVAADITGLECGSRYRFEVRALSGANIPPSEAAAAIWSPPLAPREPARLQVVSLNTSTLKVKWSPTTDTGNIDYVINYHNKSANHEAWAVTIGTEYVLTDLEPGLYTIAVQARRGCAASIPVTASAAAAERYGNTTPIRLYEQSSSNPGGLTLDPSRGGPRVVSLGPSNPIPGDVQLALYLDPAQPSRFEMGPAYAFGELPTVDRFDRTTFVSDSSYPGFGMDSWVLFGPIESRIPADGNIRAFAFPATTPDGAGFGFYVRTGTSGNYHYARIFIRNVGNRLLQGTAPDRYVEIEISYQLQANLPYAKPAAGARRTLPSVRRR